jgi:SAM-dependent methyltransferase
LDDLALEVSRFVHCLSTPFLNDTTAMHSTVAAMHALCVELSLIPENQRESEEVKRILVPAIGLHEQSPFVRRLRNWPRGYPGDFETVELLVSGKPSIASGGEGYWIEWYALNTAIAQQHRNKINWQYLIMSAGLPKRILSIGCGGGADFNVSPQTFTDYQIVLLDTDRAALELASSRLGQYSLVDTIEGDAVRGLKRALDLGPFDLVVCGGLFDYLPDRAIEFILSTVGAYGLRAGGSLIFTNISETNPFRVWMEAISNWRLLHRSREQLHGLVRNAGFQDKSVSITRDGTGLTYLVSVQF